MCVLENILFFLKLFFKYEVSGFKEEGVVIIFSKERNILIFIDKMCFIKLLKVIKLLDDVFMNCLG